MSNASSPPASDAELFRAIGDDLVHAFGLTSLDARRPGGALARFAFEDCAELARLADSRGSAPVDPQAARALFDRVAVRVLACDELRWAAPALGPARCLADPSSGVFGGALDRVAAGIGIERSDDLKPASLHARGLAAGFASSRTARGI